MDTYKISSPNYTGTDSETYTGGNKSELSSFILITDEGAVPRIIGGTVKRFMATSFYHLVDSHFQSKEELYIRSIRNLVRQKNFISLMYQLNTDQISEQEFESELESHEDKYLIKFEERNSIDHFEIISNIVQRLDIGLSLDDISEIFSINSVDLKYIDIETKKNQKAELS